MKAVDYIIVGGGLAGSVLALSLIRENKKIILIDEPTLSSSSRIAAGLFQPMTFKRTVETWKGLESIKISSEFYQWAEKLLDDAFFFPLNMHRVFSSFEEQNTWTLKCDDAHFSKLISEDRSSEAESCNIPFGYGKVHHAGYLDVQKFLVAAEGYLMSKDSCICTKFDYNLLIAGDSEIAYDEIRANGIIFCEGWMIKNNPWFSSIPMKPVKGEVITIEISDKSFNSIISGGLFCVPRKEGGYKVGSNYNWSELNETPTPEIKENFKNQIGAILNSEAIFIKKHQAGIRPASYDRRPIIGKHPKQEQLFVFNGLGARGVALAPYSASYLVRNLLKNESIPDEMNVTRFQKYFNS